MQEIITSTRKIYKGRVIKLDVHEVRLPDGNLSKREIVQHPGAVAIVALDSDQNVLLVRQFRLAANKILYEVPAGTLEPGEAPDICAERELQEEAGHKPGKLEALGGFFVAPGYTTEYIHLFLATELAEAVLDGDDDEFIEAERIPLAEALVMIERGEIVDGKTINGLLRVARCLKL
jgi:ADP-ribose pyrophosphatase